MQDGGNLKRAKQVIGGETIYSHYGIDGTLYHRLALSSGGLDDKETDFIQMGGTSLARITDEGSSTDITYIYTDHLGSPYMGANTSGNVLWTDVSTPYGESWGATPAEQTDMPGFTGHIEDSATGLTYMQARYYDPVIGRFLSTDPVQFSVARPEIFGRYTYAANGPVNMWDPDGRRSFTANIRGNFALGKVGAKVSIQVAFDTNGTLGGAVEAGYRAGGRIGLGGSLGTSKDNLPRNSAGVVAGAKAEASLQAKIGTVSLGSSVEAGVSGGASTGQGMHGSMDVGIADDLISIEGGGTEGGTGTEIGVGVDVGASAGVSVGAGGSFNIPDAVQSAAGAAADFLQGADQAAKGCLAQPDSC